jgi:hypothetical protein
MRGRSDGVAAQHALAPAPQVVAALVGGDRGGHATEGGRMSGVSRVSMLRNSSQPRLCPWVSIQLAKPGSSWASTTRVVPSGSTGDRPEVRFTWR